jgi:hypothetical protein
MAPCGIQTHRQHPAPAGFAGQNRQQRERRGRLFPGARGNGLKWLKNIAYLGYSVTAVPWYKARLTHFVQVQRFTPCRESAKSRVKARKRVIRFPMRTIASAAASCRICTLTASGSKPKSAFVSLRVTTRGLRTIEKRGVDVVVADLRAKGVKV